MTSQSFKTALAKGEYGEKIVRRILEKQGFIVYKPSTEGAHAFDVLAIKDKSRCIAMDVKAKSRRNKYPDTGINLRHYAIYRAFSEKHLMPFWLVFVDEMIGKVYGNTLDELDKSRSENGINYPMIWGGEQGTIYWPLSAMKTFHTITEVDCLELKNMSQRSHEYETHKSTLAK